MFRDDDALEEKPSINVDYLSHVWREEDIWTTRKYVLREKRTLKNGVRLENALWRTWKKQMTVSPHSVCWAKDSDITWLYGPWKSIEPSPIPPAASSQTSRQNSRHPSVTKVTKSVLKRRMTQLSIAPCTHPGNRPLRLEEEVLKTGGARAWFRLLCPEYPISKMAAWSKYIWVHTTSTKPTKVRFALEVQQCIAVNPTTTHDATYIDPKSLLQNPRSDDTFLVPGGYYPSSVHSSLFCEKRQKQTIKKLPSTGLKSSQGSIRDHRGVVDDADIAGGVFFL